MEMQNEENNIQSTEQAAAETTVLVKEKTSLHDCLGTPSEILFRLFSSYLMISGMFIISNRLEKRPALTDWMNYVLAVSLPQVLIYTAVAFLLATAFRYILKSTRFDATYGLSNTVFFLLMALWRGQHFSASIAGILLFFAIAHYTERSGVLQKAKRLSRRTCVMLIAAITILVMVFVGVTQMYRHKIFGTGCFDLGIFVQMYHSMTTNLTLETTCERAKLLSHFAVHVSPIFYLLAPLYLVFPHAETLLLVQPVIVFSGILPVYWIAKHHRFSSWTTLCFCLIYLFSSSLIGPCYFDFHENAFLPPLLMWLFWGIEKKKWWMVYLAGAFVLMVKEDAPLYLICIGLYLFSSKISRLHGSILTAVSGVYFVIVTTCLKKFGDGIMLNRFSNFTLNEESGFTDLLVNALKNPAYFFSQLICPNSLTFFFMVMIPLFFLPFLTKKLSRYFLMLPFIIMNLLVSASYGAAANVNYQYVFGTWVCLFYLSMLNGNDLKPSIRKRMMAGMACVSIISSYTLFTNHVWFSVAYHESRDHYVEMETVMDSIPKDASVACDEWHVSHLANRKEIYRLDEATSQEPSFTDFVLVREDLGEAAEEWTAKEREKLQQEGYTVYAEVEGHFKAYVSPSYQMQMEQEGN